jgi:hypothetical protein
MRLTVALAVLLVASPVAAQQNIVVNGSFDTDVLEWHQTNPLDGSFMWSPIDADDDAESGSALVNMIGFLSLYQCVPVTPGAAYDIEAMLHIPESQTATGSTYLYFRWAEDVVCSTTNLGGGNAPSLTTPGGWHLSALRDEWAPPGALAAWLAVSVSRTGGTGDWQAHVDSVSLVQVSIFRDGFEDGGTGAWTSVVP